MKITDKLLLIHSKDNQPIFKMDRVFFVRKKDLRKTHGRARKIWPYTYWYFVDEFEADRFIEGESFKDNLLHSKEEILEALQLANVPEHSIFLVKEELEKSNINVY